MTAPEGMIGRYLDICESVEKEFRRNRRLHGDRIHCRAGCSDCCHQLFQITEIEAAFISRGISRLPPDRRETLRARSSHYLNERRALVNKEVWGSVPPPGTRLACPALEDGVCQIYEYRPLICRKFGMPIFNPDKPDRIMACELNFASGEAIEDDRLVQIQTGLHHQWKSVQRDYNDGGGVRDENPITVARAIVEDFSGLV